MSSESLTEEEITDDAGKYSRPLSRVDENREPDTVYRTQRKRYPWWVRSVDEPTVAIDEARVRRMDPRKTTLTLAGRFFTPQNLEEMVRRYSETGISRYIGMDNTLELYRKKWNFMGRCLHKNRPGFNHADWALYYAAFSVQYNFSFDFDELTDKSAFVNVCERYELEPWKGSRLEASAKIEKAAIALGASQVGFTLLNPLYVYEGISHPPEMKYVIVIFTRWAPEGDRRRDTALGAMDNRICSSRENFTISALRNFIRGLGYREQIVRGPHPAYGVFAGLGELGRLNRLVSPIFGAGGRVTALVTDLPLAIDKPIDFGLQAFCRRCKKCAKACPVGAISMAREPSWEPKGEWNAPGKRVYYEDSASCYTYLTGRNTVCSLCLAACPWTKQSRTSLHSVSKSISANLPFLAGIMVFLDDLFGYGPTRDPELYEKWWDLDIPEYGLESHRRKARF